MYKKFFVLAILLGTFSCARGKPPVAPRHASMEDCIHLYNRIVQIKVDDTIDWTLLVTTEERQTAIDAFDREYADRGTTARFFSYCSDKLTVGQVRCDLKASSMREIDACQLTK